MAMLEGREEARYARFCERLLALNPSIAYVGLADRFGSLVTAAFRDGTFADEKEAGQYSMQSAHLRPCHGTL